MTFGPIALAALGLLAAWVFASPTTAMFLLAVLIGSFIGGGKFVILGSAVAGTFTLWLFGRSIEHVNLSSWYLAGLVVYGDCGTCLFMLANVGVLYRTPWLGIGRRLAQMHEAGWYLLHVHPWMRRMAWTGVVVFVAAPFQGTGAVGGTIIARILGMSNWATFTATAVGSIGGCSLIAVLGNLGRKHAEAVINHPLITVGVIVLTLAVLVLLGRWFLGHADQAKRQYLAEQEGKQGQP
jgi:hypothetical protein